MNQQQEDNNMMEEETPQLRSASVSVGGPRTLPPLSRAFGLPAKLASRPLHAQVVPTAKPLTQWSVDSILPTISADYMLERSNVYIHNSSSQQVADRIVACLASQSLSYQQQQEEAEQKNSLLAESHNGLRFQVNLFRDSQDASTIILEVQRLTGCCFAFRQICREVCRAGKGGGMVVPQPAMPRSFAIPVCLPRITPEQQSARVESEVARAQSMISSPMLDSQLLGMELLESLSKSPLAAPMVLQDGCLALLKESIMEPSAALSSLEQKCACQKKRHALAILANVQCASSKLHSELFLEVLLESVKSQDAHCAAQAARCLHSLVASSPATRAFVMQQLPETFQNLTTSHHLLLEQECSKLMSLC